MTVQNKYRVCIHDISFTRPLSLELFETREEADAWYKTVGELDILKTLPYDVVFLSMEQSCGGEWILVNRRMMME